MIDPFHFIVFSSLLFMIGAYGVIRNKNSIVVLMSVEIMLTAANINFIAFSTYSLSIAYDVFINDAAHGSFVESTRVWFSGSTYSFEFGTYIDSLAALLLLVVGLVSYLIVVFSISYMDDQGDRRIRYFAEISLFITAMYGLTVAN